MSRIRTIKPEFWTDDLIGSLKRESRLLFIASWNLADDAGRLRWSAPYLKGAVFPFDDDITVKNTESFMEQITDAGLVVAYLGGRSQQRLGVITNFLKHQRINRPQPSKLPPPDDMSGSMNDGGSDSLNEAVNAARHRSEKRSTPRSMNKAVTEREREGEREREKPTRERHLLGKDTGLAEPALPARLNGSAYGWDDGDGEGADA